MSDGIKLNLAIEPETINKYVSEAILDSVLGERLKKEINTKVESLLKDGIYKQSIVSDVVEDELRKAIRIVLESAGFQEKIQSIVNQYMVEKFTQQFVAKALDAIWEKLLR